MSSRTQWTSRTVTDALGSAGSIVLSDESTAQQDLEDWLHDYYEGLEADVEIAAEYLRAVAHEN